MTGKHMLGVTTKEVALAKKSVPGPGRAPRNMTGINYSTGALRASIGFSLGTWGGDKYGRELESIVIANSPHALMVHGGTKIHAIYPRRPGGFLKFFWVKLGKTVILPYINRPGISHPGIKIPIPFLSANLKEAIR